MFRNYRIGRLLGFPIEVNVSFLILLAFVVLWLGGLAGLWFVLVAFASVLLHELGHAVVARHLGVRVSGIELQFFGGAAKLIDPPKSANDEIAIAIAGPAVSFALGGLAMLLHFGSGVSVLSVIGWINIVIGAFNLIPALPMDGGRILRALLTRRFDYLSATTIAVKISRGVAIAGGLYALATLNVYLILLAIVLWSMGTRELNSARQLSSRFAPGPEGYTRWPGGVTVLPRNYAPTTGPKIPRGLEIRRENGRVIIEIRH